MIESTPPQQEVKNSVLVVDEDRDRPTSGALPGRLIATVLAICLVLGGAAGALIGAGRSQTYQSTTTVALQTDEAVLGADAGNPGSSDDVSDIIQGELVVIGSRAVRGAVQQRLGLRSLPSISATEAGTTDVVDITATASTAALSQREADTARVVYTQQREAELSTAATQQLSRVTAQITAVRQEIAQTPGASTDGSGALQQQYAALLAQSSQLSLDQALLPQAVRTIQSAVPGGGGLSPASTYALGGAVVGILVGLLGLALLRRVRPRIRSLDDLARLGFPLLLPVFRSREAARTGQLLAGRLLPSEAGESVVLQAVDERTPVIELVAGLAAAVLKRRDVLIVTTADAAPGVLVALGPKAIELEAAVLASGRFSAAVARRLAGDSDGHRVRVSVMADAASRAEMSSLRAGAERAGWAVLLLAPPPDCSDMGLIAAGEAGRTVVVAGRGVSRPLDVRTVLESLQGAGARDIAVMLAEGPAPAAAALRRRRSAAATRADAVAAVPAPTAQDVEPQSSGSVRVQRGLGGTAVAETRVPGR